MATNPEGETDEMERVDMRDYIRILVGRFEAMADWFDQCFDRKLPLRAAYIDELAAWVEGDSAKLVTAMRGMAKAIRHPELPLEPGIYRPEGASDAD